MTEPAPFQEPPEHEVANLLKHHTAYQQSGRGMLRAGIGAGRVLNRLAPLFPSVGALEAWAEDRHRIGRSSSRRYRQLGSKFPADDMIPPHATIDSVLQTNKGRQERREKAREKLLTAAKNAATKRFATVLMKKNKDDTQRGVVELYEAHPEWRGEFDRVFSVPPKASDQEPATEMAAEPEDATAQVAAEPVVDIGEVASDFVANLFKGTMAKPISPEGGPSESAQGREGEGKTAGRRPVANAPGENRPPHSP